MIDIFKSFRPAAEGPFDPELGAWCMGGQSFASFPSYSSEEVSSLSLYIRTFAESAFLLKAEAVVSSKLCLIMEVTVYIMPSLILILSIGSKVEFVYIRWTATTRIKTEQLDRTERALAGFC